MVRYLLLIQLIVLAEDRAANWRLLSPTIDDAPVNWDRSSTLDKIPRISQRSPKSR